MHRTILSAFLFAIVCLPTGSGEARQREQAAERATTPMHVLARRDVDPRHAPATSPLSVDVDQDGAVSPDEASAHYRWLFTFLDGNRSGKLESREFVAALQTDRPDPELRQARRQRLESMFRRLDADGDRTVFRQEFLTACRNHFSSSDRNGDGTVSVREFRSRRPL